MESPFLSVDEEIAAAKVLPGVIDFENSEEKGFQLITVVPGTDYPTLVAALNQAGIEQRHLFILEEDFNELMGEKYSEYTRETNSFVPVYKNTVDLRRMHGTLTEALIKDPAKKSHFEEIMCLPNEPITHQRLVSRINGMGVGTRKEILLKHPEWQTLLDNKDQ